MTMINIGGNSTTSRLTNIREGDVQPNAVDLRLDKVFRVNGECFIIDEDQKVHRTTTAIEPDGDQYFVLEPGNYEVVMENIITVGDDEAGFVITRSTLNRNGVFLTSGLYDTGYNGVMAGMIHVTCGPCKIKKGTRIGQYLSFKAEALSHYDGDYGIAKDHDTKYTG